jgi:hypothetical protein
MKAVPRSYAKVSVHDGLSKELRKGIALMASEGGSFCLRRLTAGKRKRAEAIRPILMGTYI